MKARTASGLVRIAVITTTATAKTPLSDFSGQQSIVKNPEKKEFCSIKKGFQNKDKKIGGGGGVSIHVLYSGMQLDSKTAEGLKMHG